MLTDAPLIHPLPALRLGRTIASASAVLLPFHHQQPDLDAWSALLERTWAAGVVPAVNMDTGHAAALTLAQRRDLLIRTGVQAKGRRFIAGAFINGVPGDPLTLYLAEVAAIRQAGGVPILFQSPWLTALPRSELLATYARCGAEAGELLAFELGRMFAPFGAIYDLDTVRGLLDIPQLSGLKHSSLDREQEHARLALRDARRPDFRIYTGNDLAIDLVQWGSDYLLGLSAFHIEAFAARDACWAAGDALFHTLNDWLQHLGMLAFRAPVPDYKHTCAQVLHLRGLIRSDEQPKSAGRRDERDRDVLRPIIDRLDQLTIEARKRIGPVRPIVAAP